ncbi:hypothetical protein E2562_003205 [Oryza meyeriana var. granulata]|uniref:Uncharacterized protein n=1 Tax=Oryza meyeriana var. granulata TaxID=110450 RepID=A0A6G1EUT0_9ORYZ|nr:hypothetical protein E2562_003205 [Oryza meyeriana var. granulata]
MGPWMSATATRSRAQGVVRSGTYSLDECYPGLGALGACLGMGRLTGIYRNFELARAWVGSEASTTALKTLGLKHCVLEGYRLSLLE